MAFRVSPGVSIKEIDLTTIVPAVATTPGGYAGYFHWGPVDEIVTITQQTELANIFGKPQNDNYVDFFTVGNFLGYGNNMQVVRVVGSGAANAHTTVHGETAYTNLLAKNETDFGAGIGVLNSTQANAGVLFAAKYPGALGNSLKVVVTSGNGITSGSLAEDATIGATFIDLRTEGMGVGDKRYFAKGDVVTFADGTNVTIEGVQVGTTASTQFTNVPAVYGDFFGVQSGITVESNGFPRIRLVLSSLVPKTQAEGNTLTIKSAYAGFVSTTATTTGYAESVGGSGDLINVLVFDKDGKWTGTENSLIEKFEGLSRASDAKTFDGSSNYYRNVINDQSAFIWAVSQDIDGDEESVSTDIRSASDKIGAAISQDTAVGEGVLSMSMGGGVSQTPSVSERWVNGWSKFADADAVDVSLLPMGNASPVLAQLVVQNVCEKRLDCMAFVSPEQSDVENKLPYEALNSIKTFRDNDFNINSSYAVLDSGWKYQLDVYNNLVRVMPLNADIAGLVARTEFTNEAWFSPAGFNRGQIKNVVKLAYNPTSEAHRDELYTRQINPVVSFPGEGVILFGDKTTQTKPSAFDRINVRRLFIILEKAIATASKFFLFEQNDAFTRAQFKNLVVPFLKTVQQRRGITDFKVVCDETNNTGEVIDRNEFIADIFIKPTRSINFITLNFIATKTGVSFSEVGG